MISVSEIVNTVLDTSALSHRRRGISAVVVTGLVTVAAFGRLNGFLQPKPYLKARFEDYG